MIRMGHKYLKKNPYGSGILMGRQNFFKKNPIQLEWPKYNAQTKEKPILIFTKISGLILSPWAQNQP